MNGRLQWMLPLLFLFSTLVHGQIYTWVDEQGVTHYSNQKFGHKKDAKEVTLKPVNFMKAVSVEALEQVSDDSASKKRRAMLTAKTESLVSVIKQCNDWKIELVSLRERLKKGYSLKEAKKLKAQKLALKDQIWRECR